MAIEGKTISVCFCIILLLSCTLKVSSESHRQACRDMRYPGGYTPCGNLIKSGLYNTEEQFCESKYYSKHCCQTCRKIQKRKLERRQREDNFLLRLLRK